MSLFDWFFPDQSQATQMRRVAEQNRRDRERRGRAADDVESRVSELEENLGFVALVLGSLLEKLDKQRVVSRADLRSAMSELDRLDGVVDGRLDVGLLRDQRAQRDVMYILDRPRVSRSSTKPKSLPYSKTSDQPEPPAPSDSTDATPEIDRLQEYLEQLRQRRSGVFEQPDG